MSGAARALEPAVVAARWQSVVRVPVGDGVHLELRDSGAANEPGSTRLPLVLLHGFTGSAESWTPLLPWLGAQRRLLAVSLHGHGDSDAPVDPARYAADRAAADLVAVLDAADVKRVAVLGYSMGGRVALRLALAHAARVSALVLESAAPGIADRGERLERRAADGARADELERDGVPAFVERWERLPMWDSQRGLPADRRATVRAERLRGNAAGLANSLRGLGAGATTPMHRELSRLAMPALVLCGALDEKYVRIGRAMAAAVPRARLAIVEDAGHTVHLERPRSFTAAVQAFLTGLEEDAAG